VFVYLIVNYMMKNGIILTQFGKQLHSFSKSRLSWRHIEWWLAWMDEVHNAFWNAIFTVKSTITCFFNFSSGTWRNLNFVQLCGPFSNEYFSPALRCHFVWLGVRSPFVHSVYHDGLWTSCFRQKKRGIGWKEKKALVTNSYCNLYKRKPWLMTKYFLWRLSTFH